ncbi:MAG: anti-sigma factor [Pyrinomonadaceae bacterium]
MKCSDLQFKLPLHSDGLLNEAENLAVAEHLSACPLCRQASADYREIRTGIRRLARPVASTSLKSAIGSSLRRELAREQRTWFSVPHDVREWIQMRLMPYGVGLFATLLVGVTFLTMMFSSMVAPTPRTAKNTERSVMVASNSNPYDQTILNEVISPTDFAKSRLGYAAESPSINPQGALIALTKSIMRGEMKDDEVVVVADVFGNGLAQVAEVVEPSRDRWAVRELEKALESDPAFAPFVPSTVESRPESVRVVLKIQSVNVRTGVKPDRTRL